MKYVVTDPNSEYHNQTLEKEGDYWHSSKGIIGVTLKVEDEIGFKSVSFTFDQVLEVEELTDDQKHAYYYELQCQHQH